MSKAFVFIWIKHNNNNQFAKYRIADFVSNSLQFFFDRAIRTKSKSTSNVTLWLTFVTVKNKGRLTSKSTLYVVTVNWFEWRISRSVSRENRPWASITSDFLLKHTASKTSEQKNPNPRLWSTSNPARTPTGQNCSPELLKKISS